MKHALPFVLLLLGCPGPGGTPNQAQDIEPRACPGEVMIEYDEWGNMIAMSDLICDSTCANGVPCSEQRNAAQDRAWCGCPGEPEPKRCHLLKERIGGDWLASCVGKCDGQAELCDTDSEETPPDAGYRSTLSCACR